MAEFKSDESAFNFAVEYLKTIAEALRRCEQAALIGSDVLWISNLRIIFRQLSCKTNEKEDENINEDFKTINRLMNNPSERLRNRTTILYLLDKLETKLRKMLQKKGMLLPSKEDPRFAVLQR